MQMGLKKGVLEMIINNFGNFSKFTDFYSQFWGFSLKLFALIPKNKDKIKVRIKFFYKG